VEQIKDDLHRVAELGYRPRHVDLSRHTPSKRGSGCWNPLIAVKPS